MCACELHAASLAYSESQDTAAMATVLRERKYKNKTDCPDATRNDGPACMLCRCAIQYYSEFLAGLQGKTKDNRNLLVDLQTWGKRLPDCQHSPL